jgi:hypothetical protein
LDGKHVGRRVVRADAGKFQKFRQELKDDGNSGHIGTHWSYMEEIEATGQADGLIMGFRAREVWNQG